VADPNRALFESVVQLLAPVLDELVFVGGCTTGLFITDPAAGGVRPTKDVDAIVDVTSYAQYAALSERLRALGLAEDTTPGAPLCRWRQSNLIVDVMPVNEHVLGFSNRWYATAIETAQTLDVAGHEVQVVTPALFVATKLEAFHGRGDDDVVASHDLEDIIAVVDGRQDLRAKLPRRRPTSAITWPLSFEHCSRIAISWRLSGGSTGRPLLKAVEEFLIHGVKYAFPAQRGEATRGMPTAYAAPPLSGQIADNGDLPPVWPDAEGDARGVTLEPLHKAAPKASKRDPVLHELLALIDALRDGRVRERQLAEKELSARLRRLLRG
jgi:hypothetical protein